MQETDGEGWSVPTDSKEPNHRFANFLKRCMEQANTDRAVLINNFDIAPATVSRWLKGNLGENPKLENFVSFAKALGVPLWQVLEEAGYTVERPTDPAESDRQLARHIEATPELRPIVQWLFDLDVDDRAAVMTFVEVLKQRRSEAGKKSRSKQRRRKVDQSET